MINGLAAIGTASRRPTVVVQRTKDWRRQNRPNIESLLAHPIRKADNGMQPGNSRAASTARSGDDRSSYEDWLLDHAGKAKFYVSGFRKIRSITRQTGAKFFHSFAAEALDLGDEIGWTGELPDGQWRVASYNQFRKAMILNEPMYVELAAQVILACECALQSLIDSDKYGGSSLDVYEMMKIVPACFNIDSFNENTLQVLRTELVNYDATILAYSGQNARHLLDVLAAGNCVTRKTARSVRWQTLKMLEPVANQLDLEIGDVRGRPGRKKLGTLNATTMEIVELDNFDSHFD